jgi:hypothetical protein
LVCSRVRLQTARSQVHASGNRAPGRPGDGADRSRNAQQGAWPRGARRTAGGRDRFCETAAKDSVTGRIRLWRDANVWCPPRDQASGCYETRSFGDTPDAIASEVSDVIYLYQRRWGRKEMRVITRI